MSKPLPPGAAATLAVAVAVAVVVVVTSSCASTQPPPPAGPGSPAPKADTAGTRTLAPATAPASGATPAPGVTTAIKDLLAAPDRTPDDRALDAGRHAAELLAFFDLAPGMRVAEVGAGGGYTAELLARAVAPGGVVYAQNNPFFLQKFVDKPWSERLARPVMKNVVRADREFDDPLPP